MGGCAGIMECSRRTCTQFVSSYFKYCETQNRHQRFSQMGGVWGGPWLHQNEGKFQPNVWCCAVIMDNSKKEKKRLQWFLARVGTFPSPRTLGYLRLCCPSFALCLPYKYSSRIKGSPLASWPVAQLSLLVPAESVRARCCGRGNTPTCLTEQIFRKFKTMTWQDTPGSTLREGPYLFVRNACGWWKRRLWPSGALKKVSVHGLCHPTGGNSSVSVFRHTFSWGTLCLSEAFTCQIYFFLLGVNPPNETGLLNTKSKIPTIFSKALMWPQLFLIHFKGNDQDNLGQEHS